MSKIKIVLLLLPLCVTICGCSKDAPIDEKSWKKSFDDGFAATQSSDLAKAEASYRAALTSAQAFSKGDERLAKTYQALGDVYAAEGKSEDAKRAYTNAYNEFKELAASRNNPLNKRDYALDLATSALHLANIACDALRLDEAERLYDEALSIEESALGSDELKGQILSGKVKLFKLTGREADAEKIAGQIAELKALPSVDDTKKWSWKQLNAAANLTHQSGNLSKAEKLFTESIERAVKPSQKAESMRGLARIYQQNKEYARGITKLEEARQLLAKDEHTWELADNYICAGWIFFDWKDFAKAQKSFLDALRILNTKDHNEATRARAALQGLTKSLGEEAKYAEAEKYAQQKLELTVQLYGKRDSRYAEDLLNIAILLGKLHKNAEAAKGYLAVIAIEEEDPSPRYMLAALDAYGKFLRETHQDNLADTIELKAKNLRAEFE